MINWTFRKEYCIRSKYILVYRVSFTFTDELQGMIPDWKWSIKVRNTLCPEMHIFQVDDTAEKYQTKNPGTQYMAWILSMSQQMFEVASMGSMFTQTPINGTKCCVMWVVLPVRVRGSVHSCCLSTVSTCLAIYEHHLGLFLEWIPDLCASTLFNSHYLQHTQPTLQFKRGCRQCHLPCKLCISGHKVIWTFILHSQSGITLPPYVCRWT